MRKIILIGNSAGLVEAAESIRNENKEDQIQIISFDASPPLNQELFTAYIADEKNEEGLNLKNTDFYKSNNIELITDQKITRLNLNRKKIHTESIREPEKKTQYDFDVLIMSDMPEHRLSSIKGANKSNVFGFSRKEDIDTIKKEMPYTDTIAVEVISLTGLKLAEAIIKFGKEVALIIPEFEKLKSNIGDDLKSWFEELLTNEKLSVYKDAAIEEILGEGDTKALRLNLGKVVGCEMVIFAQSNPDYRAVEEFVSIESGIVVNEQHKTSVDHVYAIDRIAQTEQSQAAEVSFSSQEELARQGNIVAKAICSSAVEV